MPIDFDFMFVHLFLALNEHSGENLSLLLLVNPANRFYCNNQATSQIREAGFYFNVRNSLWVKTHCFGCVYLLWNTVSIDFV